MENRINIDDLHEIADSLSDELDEHMSLIGDFARNISKSDFPFTFFSFLSFIPKVESIRIAIFELVELGEFYSEKILFRAITEHYLKFQYIWMRYTHEKTDDAGKDYYVFCGAKEELDFAKSLQTRAKVLGEQINIDPLDLLKKLDGRFKDESNKSLKMRAEQFTHRSIAAYVSSKLNANSEEPRTDFVANIIPAYSELSSFVHGGPSTQRYSEACSNPEVARQELRSNAAVSLQMSFAVKAHAFLLFAQIDKRLFLPFQIVNKALKTKFENLKDA